MILKIGVDCPKFRSMESSLKLISERIRIDGSEVVGA